MKTAISKPKPKPQSATLPNVPHFEGKFTTAHRNEGRCTSYGFQVIDLADPFPTYDAPVARPKIELRLYGNASGTANTAAFWVCSHASDGKRKELFTSGTGKATGSGYHRPSAAAQYAINNAGITLALDIDGRGDAAIEKALLAIAAALGIKKPLLVRYYQ